MPRLMHQANPFRKSAMTELQEAYKEEFEIVSSQRCRTDTPLAFMPFWFLTFFQLKYGKARLTLWIGDVNEIGTCIYGDWRQVNATLTEAWYEKQLKVRPLRFCIEDDFSTNDQIVGWQMAL